MEIIKTPIDDVFIIKPRVYEDARGYFYESFSQKEFDENIGRINFVQDNQSKSTYGVLRGLHFQKPPYAQSKLVRCVLGRVLDICVDSRNGSPTFGKHVAVEISDKNHLQVFIPKGFAHGFAVLSEEAVFQYKCDEYYMPNSEGGISPFDQSLNIDWQINIAEANCSDKDRKYPLFSEIQSEFVY